MNGTHSLFRAAGSLWFAAVLLVLLMVAMACATVFESMHSTERALVTFYHARWFKLLLGLLAVNLLAAVVLRYPFSKRQIGFVVAHAGILLTLSGALVTERFSVNGQVSIAEGQTVKNFTTEKLTLTVVSKTDHTQSSIDLNSSVFGGFEAVDHPKTEELSLGNLRIEVERYLPDMIWRRQVLNNNSHPHPAVEVSLSPTGEHEPTWIFLDQSSMLGSVGATFSQISDREQLDRLLSKQDDEEPHSKGTVIIEFAGSTFEIPLEDCLDQVVPLGETGYTTRVLRYMPHAIVGEDNKIMNASNEPLNPAIEAEIAGPAGSEKRLAFAKFPDFKSMHLKKEIEAFKLTFRTPTTSTSKAPVEVLRGPDGDLFVRFSWTATPVTIHKLDPGKPIETPWPGKKFALLRYFDHAKVKWSAIQPDPIRKKREPAVLLKLTNGEHTKLIRVQKYRPRSITIADTPYELIYGDKGIPLRFNLKLNRFRIGYYPGGNRPRSFESHITITDPATGLTQDRIISMNNPAEYGGYTFYQSSYRQEAGSSFSILSVARDPGQPIAFAGYIATIVGMLVVLGTRMMEQRKSTRLQS